MFLGPVFEQRLGSLHWVEGCGRLLLCPGPLRLSPAHQQALLYLFGTRNQAAEGPTHHVCCPRIMGALSFDPALNVVPSRNICALSQDETAPPGTLQTGQSQQVNDDKDTNDRAFLQEPGGSK